MSFDTLELRRLVNEYRHACDMVQGHAIPQWRNLVAYLDGETAKLRTNLETAVKEAWRANAALSAGRESSCEWPLCQSAEMQDAVAAEVYRQLYSGEPEP